MPLICLGASATAELYSAGPGIVDCNWHQQQWAGGGGSKLSGSSATHAFITGANGSGMTDLNSMVALANGAYPTVANGINDSGQILASGTDGHSYLLTVTAPVPEPETYAMLLAGLGVIGVVSRRRTTKSIV